MRPHSESRGIGALPRGFLGMLFAIVAIESSLARHDRDFTTIWAAAWSRLGPATREEAPEDGLLLFGDSLIMQGLAPRVVTAHSGLSSHNLAVFKGLAPASYFLLRRAYEAGKRPAAVVIDGELLDENPKSIMRLWPELLSLEEAAELSWTARDLNLFCGVVTSKFLPSLKLRHEVRDSLLAALEGHSKPNRGAIAQHMRNWRSNFGANIHSADTLAPHDARETLANAGYLPSDMVCHPINLTYVENFITLAESNGVFVFWLLPPVHPEVQERRDRGGLSYSFERLLRDLQTRHPTLVVLDGRRARFPESALADLTHLNVTGAVALSATLGDVVKSRLAASDDDKSSHGARWVMLPIYQELPTHLADVEDLKESGHAVRQASRGRAAAR